MSHAVPYKGFFGLQNVSLYSLVVVSALPVGMTQYRGTVSPNKKYFWNKIAKMGIGMALRIIMF